MKKMMFVVEDAADSRLLTASKANLIGSLTSEMQANQNIGRTLFYSIEKGGKFARAGQNGSHIAVCALPCELDDDDKSSINQ